MFRSRFLMTILSLGVLAGLSLADDAAKLKARAALALASASTCDACRECAPQPVVSVDPAKAERQKKAAAALKSATSATPKATYRYIDAPGWHVHECPLCHSEWSHKDTNKGNVDAHTCPGCGSLTFDPSIRGVRLNEPKDEPADADGNEPVLFLDPEADPPLKAAPSPTAPTKAPTYHIERRTVCAGGVCRVVEVMVLDAVPGPVNPPPKAMPAAVPAPVIVSKSVTVVHPALFSRPVFHPFGGAHPVRSFFGRVFGRR